MAEDMDVTIKTNVKGDARRKIMELGRGMSVAGGSAARMGRMSYLSFAGIAAAAASLVTMIGIGFAVKAVKAFMEFEDSLNRTRAIMGLTRDEFSAVETEVKELGATTRFTARQVAEATQILSVAGITMDEMVTDKAIQNLLFFAQAGGVSMAEATGIGVASVKAFGLEMIQLEYVGDVLTKTFTSSNVTIGDLGETMKLAAPGMHAAGVSIEEVAAAAGTLGNRGIKGTMAGTAMRRAVTQLIKPSDAARKILTQMGATFFTLSPAGMAAQSAIKGVQTQLDAASAETARFDAEMRQLTSAMTGLNVDQMRNDLEIMKIKRRAEREGRAMTEEELSRISRLEGANSDLAISQQELQIQQTLTRVSQQEAEETQKALQETFTGLNEVISSQTTGITSLKDVLDQLGAASITTTQLMEMFGIRGGTAMAALLGGMGDFDMLSEKIANSEGTMRDFALALEDTAVHKAKIFNSRLEAMMIQIGEKLTPVLVTLLEAFTKEGGLFDALVGTEEKAGPLIVLFDELAKLASDKLVPMIIEFIEAIIEHVLPNMGAWIGMIAVLLDLFVAMIPLIQIVVGLMMVIMAVVAPVIQAIAGLVLAVASLLTLDFSGVMDGLEMAAKGIGNLLLSPMNIVAGVQVMGGADAQWTTVDNFGEADGGGTSTSMSGTGGTHRGGVFAEGGIITAPTNALMGEAGPEAVIPLQNGSVPVEMKYNREFSSPKTNLNIVIEQFTAIGTTTEDLADLIVEQLPKKIIEEVGDFLGI